MKKVFIYGVILSTCCFMCSCGTTKEKAGDSETKQESVSEQDVEKENQKVIEVINSINEIGSVSLESKAKIDTAKGLYAGLTDDEKALVTNFSVLEAAENQYSSLAKAEKDRLINTYQQQFDIEHDKVENVTWYTPKSMPEYIDTRCYLIPYIGVQNDNAWICVRYNYTEDDWVFWKSLSIVADGEKFTKNVGAFNTVRDNDGGVVWEYYDEILGTNATMDSTSIQVLQKIANSSETIVRFQGDEYHYDLIVTNQDKNMIKDVLALYSAFVAY